MTISSSSSQPESSSTPGFNIPSKEVSDFHNHDDVDSSAQAHHHTLGKGHNQSAPGSHDHKPIHVTGYLSANQAIAHATVTDVANYTGVVTDEVNLPYSGLWTVKKAGWYRIYANFMWTTSGATSNLGATIINVNGAIKNLGRSFYNNGAFYGASQASWEGQLNVNDTIKFQVYLENNLAAGHNLGSGIGNSFYSICRVGD